VTSTVSRDLDQLISQYVLGHQVIEQRKGGLKERTRLGHVRPLRAYSKDIGAAWEVAEKMAITLIPIQGGKWFAMVGNAGEAWGSPADFLKFLGSADFTNAGAAVEDSPALTICLAALQAVQKRDGILFFEQSSATGTTH
jgi:hypothetical protein